MPGTSTFGVTGMAFPFDVVAVNKEGNPCMGPREGYLLLKNSKLNTRPRIMARIATVPINGTF